MYSCNYTIIYLGSSLVCTVKNTMLWYQILDQNGQKLLTQHLMLSPQHICFQSVHILHMYAGMRCPLGSIIYMVYSWSTGRAVGEATKDVKIGTKMGINIYQWCRDICSWKLINGPPRGTRSNCSDR